MFRSWNETYTNLYSKNLALSDKKQLNFNLEFNQINNTICFNIRQMVKTNNYVGPTKNGLKVDIDSKQALESFEKEMLELIQFAKQSLK